MGIQLVFFIFLVFQGTLIFALDYSPNKFVFPRGSYFLSYRRNQGQTIGNKNSYSTIETRCFPTFFHNAWPFIDLRYHFSKDCPAYAGNIGFGLRIKPETTNIIFGINSYYDIKKVHNTCFNQIGIGAELFSCLCNMRLNGYIPVGKKKIFTSSCLFDEYEGGYFILRENFLKSLKGVNFEIECLLAKICCTDVFLAFGTYFYKNGQCSCKGNIYGTEYRLSIQPCSIITFDVMTTQDNMFKNRFQAQLTLTLPLKCLCEYQKMLFQPVRRHEMIAVAKESWWTWNY